MLRLPDSAPAPEGRSDRYTTTTLGAAFDQTFSQQRILANASQTAVRYDKLTRLDRDSSAYRIEWQWVLTPRLTGSLSTDYSQGAVQFTDITVGRRLITTSNRGNRLSADAWLAGGWHLLGGVSRTEYKNDQPFAAIPSTDQTNEEVGLRYVAESESSITAMRRWSRGLYPGQNGNLNNLVDTGFRVREYEVSGTWMASAQSTLIGRFTHTERNYDHLTQLDFSGNGGEVRYTWLPTGQLTFNLSALRTILPYFQTATSGSTGGTRRIDTTLAFAPSWQVSDRVNLNAQAARLVTDYPGSLGLIQGPERRDTTRRFSVGAAWSVHRYVTLNANVNRERRTSNVAGVDYDDTLGGVTVRLTF